MADSGKKSKSKQLRKCIICLSDMLSDQHCACSKCRKAKKGPDVCVLGRDVDCKICHPSETAHATRYKTKTKIIDDSLLDEDLVQSSPVAQKKYY